MIQWYKRHTPIAVDIGERSLKLLQLSGDQSHVLEALRWDRSSAESSNATLSDQLREAVGGHCFKGREVVICLNANQLFLQNIRLPKSSPKDYPEQIRQELEGRLPYAISDAEIRHMEAADVRHGDTLMREIIVFCCQKIELHRLLDQIVAAGLRPVAVNVEPLALLRSFLSQYRRDEDRAVRSLYAHVGFGRTLVLITEGDKVLFVKYVDVGGRHLDETVARQFQMELDAANSLRRNNGDRRAQNQDPELAASVAEATRPVVERLASEIAMCIRYHSVTFRGTPIARIVLGGGEASPAIAESLGKSLQQDCQLSDPLREIETEQPMGRTGQWDIATGLALRNVYEEQLVTA